MYDYLCYQTLYSLINGEPGAMVPDCPPGSPGEEAALSQKRCRGGGGSTAPLPQGLLYHKLRDQPLTPLQASVFLTLNRKLRKHRAPRGTDCTQLCAARLLFLFIITFLAPPPSPKPSMRPIITYHPTCVHCIPISTHTT